MKNVVFWDRKQFPPQRKHITSQLTEPNSLMIPEILRFHGGDYEEFRLLGYKTQFVLHRRHITSPLQNQSVNAM
jgi:hypothetical protein